WAGFTSSGTAYGRQRCGPSLGHHLVGNYRRAAFFLGAEAVDHDSRRAGGAGERLDRDQLGRAERAVRIEAEMGQADLLFAGIERTAGADRARVDDHDRADLLQLLLVGVAGRDGQRLAVAGLLQRLG